MEQALLNIKAKQEKYLANVKANLEHQRWCGLVHRMDNVIITREPYIKTREKIARIQGQIEFIEMLLGVSHAIDTSLTEEEALQLLKLLHK